MAHRLDPLLRPQSIAVLGASEREGTVGRNTVENLLKGGYEGGLYAVNPGRKWVLGVPCYPVARDAARAGRARDLRGRRRAHGRRARRRDRAWRARGDDDVLAGDRGRHRPAAARPAAREDPEVRPRRLRRERHGLLQLRRRHLGLRLPDAHAPARRQRRLHQPLGLGHVRHRRQRGAHRLQPRRVDRPGARGLDGRVPRLRARDAGHARGRPVHGDGAQSRRPRARLRAGARARHPGRRAEGGAHRALGEAHRLALRRDRGRGRGLRRDLRPLRRAPRARHGRARDQPHPVRAAAPRRRRRAGLDPRLRRRAPAADRPRLRPRRAADAALAGLDAAPRVAARPGPARRQSARRLEHGRARLRRHHAELPRGAHERPAGGARRRGARPRRGRRHPRRLHRLPARRATAPPASPPSSSRTGRARARTR